MSRRWVRALRRDETVSTSCVVQYCVVHENRRKGKRHICRESLRVAPEGDSGLCGKAELRISDRARDGACRMQRHARAWICFRIEYRKQDYPNEAVEEPRESEKAGSMTCSSLKPAETRLITEILCLCCPSKPNTGECQLFRERNGREPCVTHDVRTCLILIRRTREGFRDYRECDLEGGEGRDPNQHLVGVISSCGTRQPASLGERSRQMMDHGWPKRTMEWDSQRTVSNGRRQPESAKSPESGMAGRRRAETGICGKQREKELLGS